MRMWMVPVIILCKQHLVGEHGEIHKHRHNFVKRHSITGRIYPVVQIEPMSMKIRHDELAEELLRRRGNHKSPYDMPDLTYLPDIARNVKVDIDVALNELINRCPACRERYEQYKEVL